MMGELNEKEEFLFLNEDSKKHLKRLFEVHSEKVNEHLTNIRTETEKRIIEILKSNKKPKKSKNSQFLANLTTDQEEKESEQGAILKVSIPPSVIQKSNLIYRHVAGLIIPPLVITKQRVIIGSMEDPQPDASLLEDTQTESALQSPTKKKKKKGTKKKKKAGSKKKKKKGSAEAEAEALEAVIEQTIADETILEIGSPSKKRKKTTGKKKKKKRKGKKVRNLHFLTESNSVGG